jgi:uncharacterized protein (DUF1684 family)
MVLGGTSMLTAISFSAGGTRTQFFFFGNTGSKHGLGRYIDADGNKFFGRWDKDFCYFYQPEEAIPNNVNVFIPKITEFR